MTIPAPSFWRRAARFLFAWVLMLLGLLLATPALGIIVEAVLPYFERTPWRSFFNDYTLGEIAQGITQLLPSMAIWTFAWLVRSGRPVHRLFFGRPWTPGALQLHLASAIPEFRHRATESPGKELTFRDVFTQFGGCYRQRYAEVSQLWLHEIGTLVSEFVTADNPTWREAGLGFLENLSGDPSLDPLRPFLSQQALAVIARHEPATGIA